jgi:hypothetical protein
MLILRRSKLYIYSIWYRHSLWAAVQCTGWERSQSDEAMYIQSVSLNAFCLAEELGWSDVHTECIFKCMPARKKYNLPLPRRKCWNFINLQTLEYQMERESCFMNHTACELCVCVCVICILLNKEYSFATLWHDSHYMWMETVIVINVFVMKIRRQFTIFFRTHLSLESGARWRCG